MQEISYNHRFSLIEGLLYRYLLIPQTKQALLEQKKEFACMDSRPRWGPGRIDLFNPIKFRVLGMPVDGNSDMMSIWNRQAHAGQALHWDGLISNLPAPAYPYAIDHVLAAKVQQVFQQQQCNVCHALEGQRTGRSEKSVDRISENPIVKPMSVERGSLASRPIRHASGGERTN
jgi:hypothetical protein